LLLALNANRNAIAHSIHQHHFTFRAVLPRYRNPALLLVACLFDVAAVHRAMPVQAHGE